jgi:hypothetical protein
MCLADAPESSGLGLTIVEKMVEFGTFAIWNGQIMKWINRGCSQIRIDVLLRPEIRIRFRVYRIVNLRFGREIASIEARSTTKKLPQKQSV